VSLRDAWEGAAASWITWARAPGHDSYWRFHRDQFFELLPSPGRRTLDLGCGEGRVARDLVAMGHAVVALDASPTLAAAARRAVPGLRIVRADAGVLPFPERAFDLVIAFMSLQDVDDMSAAVAEAARVLEPGGRLCLAIVHPVQSAGKFVSDDEDAPFVIGSYLDAHPTAETLERDGFSMTFHSAHRPLEAYARALEAAGFLIERLREHKTTREQTRTARWTRVPLFLHVRAVKPA
jgi:ubiquinone/menaquinone biosynthesis C-methylase UbiE